MAGTPLSWTALSRSLQGKSALEMPSFEHRGPERICGTCPQSWGSVSSPSHVVVSAWFSEPRASWMEPTWLGLHKLGCVTRRKPALLPAGGGDGRDVLVPPG